MPVGHLHAFDRPAPSRRHDQPLLFRRFDPAILDSATTRQGGALLGDQAGRGSYLGRG